MDSGWALLLTVCAGGCVGWWLRRSQVRFAGVLLVGIAIAVGAPVVLFVMANILSSATLGWIAGLSLMVVFMLGVPLLAGIGVGWMLAPKPREETPASLPEPQQAAPIPTPSVTVDQPRAPDFAIGPQQRGVLVATAGVGALFWVLLWLGFRWGGQQPPAELTQGVLPAGVVLIATLALGVRWMWRRRETLANSFALPDLSIDVFAKAERRKWLASLAADPRRQRYAAMIEAGDSFWTTERIEYDLDPNATTCCEHVAPIEMEMRSFGVIVRLSGAGVAAAQCRIDADVLSRRFDLPEGVAYQELHNYDRSIHDPPEARLHCDVCSSSLWVRHPDVAAPDTPVFPSTK